MKFIKAYNIVYIYNNRGKHTDNIESKKKEN